MQVQSDSAPDDIAERTPIFTTGSPGSRLKIGDPNTTITGRHRYRIDYALPRSELLPNDDETVEWDAVGTAWEVPIGRAEIHIVAPWRFQGGHLQHRRDRGHRWLHPAPGGARTPGGAWWTTSTPGTA